MPGGWGSVAKGWLKKRASSSDRTGSVSWDSDAALRQQTDASRGASSGSQEYSADVPEALRHRSADAVPLASKMSNDSAYVVSKAKHMPGQEQKSGASSVARTTGSIEASPSRSEPHSISELPTSTSTGGQQPQAASLRFAGLPQEQVPSQSPTWSPPSQRSSFMLERASRESNRASLDMFGLASDRASIGSREGSDSSRDSRLPLLSRDSGARSASLKQLQAAAQQAGVPERLWKCYLALVVVPPSTPLPATMLALLWSLEGPAEAEATANDLAQHGVLRVAHLEDGSTWTLPQPEHMTMLQAHPPENLAGLHSALVSAYVAQARVSDLVDLPDDGYILQTLGHHLTWAQRLDELKDLLCNPDWLEAKLHGYGTINVVADFRRYLMAKADDDVKLMLDAYQMSVSSCLQHPEVSLLRSQMTARLMAVRPHAFKVQKAGAAARPHSARRLRALQARGPSMEQAGGLQRMTLRGHTAGLQKVLLSPSGIDVITASQDGTARVWDLEIGDCVLVMEGHTAPVTSVAVAGSVLLTSSQDCTVRAWDMDQGRCLHTLQGHTAAVNAVAITQNATQAVSVSSDETVRIWDLTKGRCLHTLPDRLTGAVSGVIWCVALMPDDKYAVTGSEDFIARIWSMKSGACKRELTGHRGWIMEVAVLRDGSRVLTASHDGTARIWDWRSGECEHVLEGHSGRVTAVKVAANGLTAITAADDATARVWDVKTGACRHVLEGHSSWVSDAALTANGALGVTCSGDELAVAWDLRDGSFLRILDGHCAEIRAAVLTERGRFAVTAAEDATARVWDLQVQPLPAPTRHSSRVHRVCATADGSTALSLGGDGLLLWDPRTGLLVRDVEDDSTNVRYLAVSEDGQHALTATATSAIFVWNLETGACERKKEGAPGSRVRAFAASADLERAAIVLFDSSISVWDVVSMSLACVLQTRGERDANFGHSSGVNGVAITRDGGLVVTVSKDETARVWNVHSGSGVHVLRGHTGSVTGVAISPDGALAATVGFDGTARVWSLASGNCAAVLQHGSAVALAVFSHDGAHLATCAGDHVPTLWDLASGRCLHKLKAHKGEVSDMAFSLDSRLLASASKDSSLCLWSCTAGRLESLFMADGALTCCTLVGVGGGETAVAGSESGAVHILGL